LNASRAKGSVLNRLCANGWERWLKTEQGAVAQSTHERYSQIVRDFLLFLDTRAELRLEGLITDDEARMFLEQNLEAVCAHLYRAGKRDGAHFDVGNIEGAPGESFRVCLQGANRGLKDFASGGER
jgi:hypothetical protein